MTALVTALSPAREMDLSPVVEGSILFARTLIERLPPWVVRSAFRAAQLMAHKPVGLLGFLKFAALWWAFLWAVFRVLVRPFSRDFSLLRNSCVLVTGCDYGFGKNIALRMHAEGAVVFAGVLSPASAEQLQAAVSKPEERWRMRAVVLNVTNQGDCDRVRREVEQAGRCSAMDSAENAICQDRI